MGADAILLPAVFGDDVIGLGYVTVSPTYPSFDVLEPSPDVRRLLASLEAASEPTKNNVMYWGVGRRGWLALQLSRLLGVEGGVDASCALAIEGGSAQRHEFRNVTAAFEAVFSDKSTQKWVNKVAGTTKEVYFVVVVDKVWDAKVKHAVDKSGGAATWVAVPISELGTKLGATAGWSLTDVGILDAENIKGVYAVGYHKVKIHSDGSADPLKPSVRWVRPATVVMGAAGKESVIDVTLDEFAGLDELSDLMKAEMEDDEAE